MWKDIGELFQRKWFERVWVVQELVLASKVRVVCGKWDVNWDDIFSALEICKKRIEKVRLPNLQLRHDFAHAQHAFALGLTRRMFKDLRVSRRRFSLLYLLDTFAHTDSTEERDKLFALLGLAYDAGDEAFNPDYSSPFEVVVLRYATAFVERGDALELLYRAGASKSYNFCSWIPKGNDREPCRTISTWRGSKGIFSAGVPDQAQIQTQRPKRTGDSWIYSRFYYYPLSHYYDG